MIGNTYIGPSPCSYIILILTCLNSSQELCRFGAYKVREVRHAFAWDDYVFLSRYSLHFIHAGLTGRRTDNL